MSNGNIRYVKSKAEWEKTIFQQFICLVKDTFDFDIDIQSIKNEDPPRPDMSCSIAGKTHFFELTEITDNDLARAYNKSLKEMRPIPVAYSQDEPLTRAIGNKAKKNYEDYDGPLELLSYYDKQAMPLVEAIKPATFTQLHFIIQNMLLDKWYRIWIYDFHRNEILDYADKDSI